jgi:hypothetical protein
VLEVFYVGVHFAGLRRFRSRSGFCLHSFPILSAFPD